MGQNFNLKKTFLVLVVISLSISALIGIFIFLFGDFGETETKILLTTLILGGYSLSGLCCSTLYARRRARPLAFLGIDVSILGFLYTVLLIWEIIGLRGQGVFKLLYIFIILAFSLAHSCLLLLIRAERSIIKTSLFVTLGFIGIVALMLILLVLGVINDPGGFYFRLLGVFAILDVLGTIAVPILNKVYSIQH